MRIAVFASNSNPSVDRFLLKKSVSYVQELVSTRRARMLDPRDLTRGVILYAHDAITDSYERAISHAAGSGFDTAWSIRQSGYAGPLCWQLKTSAISA